MPAPLSFLYHISEIQGGNPERRKADRTLKSQWADDYASQMRDELLKSVREFQTKLDSFLFLLVPALGDVDLFFLFITYRLDRSNWSYYIYSVPRNTFPATNKTEEKISTAPHRYLLIEPDSMTTSL